MGQPVMYENASRQRENLCLVLQPPERGGKDEAVIIALEFRTVVFFHLMILFQSQALVGYQLLPVHVCFFRFVTKVIKKVDILSFYFKINGDVRRNGYFCIPKAILFMTEVKVINKSHHALPQYATPGSAGMDLRANLDAPMILKPLERCLVPTGLYIALPHGTEAQIRPRSGLALKRGITVLNSPGTIDEDYRGEIRVILANLSSEPFEICDGERIAQMVVARYEQADWKIVECLDETERGAGGFGHSGEK